MTNSETNSIIDSETETLDAMYHGAVKLIQPRYGYRFSVDALLLADFAPRIGHGYLLDLGAGCGVIPLLMMHQNKCRQAIAIEFQRNLVEMVKKNAEINGVKERITVNHIDVMDYPVGSLPQPIELVTINPPYFQRGSGKLNSNESIALARHESTASLADFLIVASNSLSENGRIVIVFPANQMNRLSAAIKQLRLSQYRQQFVCPRPDKEPWLVLIELGKKQADDFVIEEPIALETSEGLDSQEAIRIYAGLPRS